MTPRKRAAFLCEAPKHPGDRQVHPLELYAKRIEYRRVDGNDRLRVKEMYRICKACVIREADTIDEDQGALWP